MLILLLTLVAAHLNFSQPVFDPPKKDTVEEAESYIKKPLIAETEITPEPVYKPVESAVEYLYQDSTNNCVAWAKREVGIPQTQSIGDGARLAINSHEPKPGAIGSLKGVVHAVVVEEVNNGMVTFRENNYRTGWVTRRTLPESSFIGYIYI